MDRLVEIESGVRPLSSFILKVASRCNLDCTYCYEYNKGDESWRQQPHFTSLQTVEVIGNRVRDHALGHALDSVAFSFHGGEPLLAGAGFFREAVGIIRDRLGSAIRCTFGVQTNGTLITEEIIDIFNEEEIYIGLSLDGPRAVNDRYRIRSDGRGSFDDVLRGVQCLLTPSGRKVFRGILCVIDRDSDPLEVFEFLADMRPPSVDFLLPHGNWSAPPSGKETSYENTVYADWLIAIFDSWFDGNHSEVEIRTFEEIIEYKLGGQGHLETLGLAPVSLICVAADGSIESVDTLKSAFHGAHQLGLSVYRNSFDDALRHNMIRSRQMGLDALSEKCVQCALVETCGGGYFPHRWSKSNGFRNPSVYCSDYTKLISHINKRVEDVLGGKQATG
jgi:uncharacterized protein